MPLIVSTHTDFPHKIFAIKPYILKTEPWERLEPETIAALYPLHQSLVNFLQYLTTTSLLPAEVHLMSIGLINLLLCAEMPPTIILQTILWLGGLGAYILVGPVIRWNIALARVPRWRFRRVGRLIQMRQSFLSTLNQALVRSRSAGPTRLFGDSDADDDHEDDGPPRRKSSIISLETIKSELLGSLKTNLFPSSAMNSIKEVQSAIEPVQTQGDELQLKESNDTWHESTSRPRRNTLPNLITATNPTTITTEARKRKSSVYGKTLFGRSFSSLTQNEATLRKWGYALYTYTIMILLILGPIRNLIGRYALNGHEPFGWAVSYLFGNIPQVRRFVSNWSLTDWIPLPPVSSTAATHLPSRGLAEHLRHVIFQEANTRLLLCAWCILILITGLGVVLSFTFVEVDTRRKVFHGTMVAMLLPTIPIDPCFASLALVIILAVFLILDLLRASQLPPLSRPIAMFLTPYVDGRDLRGPVVVSHIFLLVGCAVPLWLSLAGATFEGKDPWQNWEVQKRDVSMVAGVVCVGMGDAAASLIGRRYGRRKWPWTGGKSLEGSAAFALAVTIGLVASKVWLRLGEWEEAARRPPASRGFEGYEEWLATATKAGVAACGASFMEAVLTGGNDNVVVPVGLWVLVKALEV
jgi:dolichol kinase